MSEQEEDLWQSYNRFVNDFRRIKYKYHSQIYHRSPTGDRKLTGNSLESGKTHFRDIKVFFPEVCTLKFEIKLCFHPTLTTLQVVSAAPDIPLLVGGDSLHALRGPVGGSGDRHRYPTHRGSGHHPTASAPRPGSTACRSRHLDAEIREDPDHGPRPSPMRSRV